MIVVGCAPTALAEVNRLIDAGALRPALVIGTPVGYVGAAEAKEALLELSERTGVPSIVLRGDRGGAAVAAAMLNALVRLSGSTTPLPRRPASLLLIGHGTRSAQGADELQRFAATVAKARPAVAVAAGFIEFVEPTLDQAIDGLVEAGATRVVAVPLLLLGAGHLKDDGPSAMARARTRHLDTTFSYAASSGCTRWCSRPWRTRSARCRSRRPRMPDGPTARTTRWSWSGGARPIPTRMPTW